ncbi:lysozyme inhibitor LprI family protein [Mesorhizobium sp. ORM6]
MRRIFPYACLVVLAATAAARAQECDRSDDSQQMMNICAGEDYQAADARLNKAYQDLISSDDADDGNCCRRHNAPGSPSVTPNARTPRPPAQAVPSTRWRFRNA